MIMFLAHKINPKVFCPNFGVHFMCLPKESTTQWQGAHTGYIPLPTNLLWYKNQHSVRNRLNLNNF